MSLLAVVVAAAVQSSLPAPPKVDCGDADHRALDFWIGEWDVVPTGLETVIARSRIEKIVDCAISEAFDQSIGPGGKPADYHGRSISSYVPAENVWRQFYVDSNGTAASFTGGIADGAMVLVRQAPIGTIRMTLRPNPDGTVRQQSVVSRDGGKTWIPSYDFTYRRR